MAKAKTFRVAVAGETIDGRTIEPQWLDDAVATFNSATYGVRCNVEHVRGMSGDKPFGAVGDVVALSVQDDDLVVAGKTEKRRCLYAAVLPNERAIELNKAGQKVFTSIELLPNFCGSNKWGLAGLALTDAPASIGTERLQFARATGALTVTGNEEIKFDDDAAASALTAFTEFFKNMNTKLSAAPAGQATQQTAVTPPTQTGAEPEQFSQVMGAIAALGKVVEESSKATDAAVAELRQDHNALKASLETQEARSFTRAPATGNETAAKKEDLSDF